MKPNKLLVRLCVLIVVLIFLSPANAIGQIQLLDLQNFESSTGQTQVLYKLATGEFSKDESIKSDFLHIFYLSASLQRTGLLILAALVAVISFIIIITRSTLKEEFEQLSEIDSDS